MAAGAGGIKASANMWALLNNNDPGHSDEAAAAAIGEPESSGGAEKHGSEGKKERKKQKKKQKEKQKKAAAVANGEVNADITGGEHQNHNPEGSATGSEGETEDDGGGGYSSGQYDDGSDEDEGGDAAKGGSRCWEVLQTLLSMAVVMLVTALAEYVSPYHKNGES